MSTAPDASATGNLGERVFGEESLVRRRVVWIVGVAVLALVVVGFGPSLVFGIEPRFEDCDGMSNRGLVWCSWTAYCPSTYSSGCDFAVTVRVVALAGEPYGEGPGGAVCSGAPCEAVGFIHIDKGEKIGGHCLGQSRGGVVLDCIGRQITVPVEASGDAQG